MTRADGRPVPLKGHQMSRFADRPTGIDALADLYRRVREELERVEAENAEYAALVPQVEVELAGWATIAEGLRARLKEAEELLRSVVADFLQGVQEGAVPLERDTVEPIFAFLDGGTA